MMIIGRWQCDDIERVNQDIYDNINNGVYKAGFATSTTAYEDAVHALFAALDRMEARLERQRYLMGRALPKLTGVFLQHWCDLTRSMWGILNVICAALQIIRLCLAICAISIRCRGLPKP